MRFGPKLGVILVTLMCLTAATAVGQQMSRIPQSEKQMKIQHIVMPGDDAGHAISTPTLKKNAAGAIEVGRMWNGYTSLLRASNQIAWDPWTNTLMTIQRGDRTHGGAGEIVFSTSTDGGRNWTTSGTMNTGLGNDAGQLTARHPSILLHNQNKSTTRGDVKLAAIWGNLHSTAPRGFYEIPYMGGPLGSNYAKKKLSVSPPDLGAPNRVTVVPQTGKMYSLTEGIDPSTGYATGEFFLLTSTDQGSNWTIDTGNPVIVLPLIDGYTIYDNPTLDVSPDGQTIAIGFVGILTDNNGSFRFIDSKLGYIVSNDGGATWDQPVLVPVTEWNFLNVDFDAANGFYYPNLSMVIDAQKQPHFLVTVTSDDFYPLDSTYLGEVTYNGSSWDFFGLAYINNPWFKKFVSPGAAGQAQTIFNIWNEHEFAKSYDGNKIYAKWIDPDSLFVTTPAGHVSPIARDTTYDVFMTGKDIRSNTPARGWVDIVNISNTPSICEKFTKIAPFVGDDNRIHMVYTIFAEGEFVPGKTIPDVDDQSEAQLFYMPDVFIDAAVAVDNTTEPLSFTLNQNYPNPFNPSTTISFTLRESARASMKIYNLLGREVATVFDGMLDMGSHTVNFDASQLGSGTYIYKLQAGSQTASRTMMLVK